jgi:putative ABC transport system permease protein
VIAELPVAVAVARSHLRRHWRSLVLLGLVAGLVGGVATAAFAGARRTSTAYDRLLVASDHADAYLQLLEADPATVDAIMAATSLERATDALYVVGRHTEAPNVVLLPVQASATPMPDPVVRRGRLADPAAVDEVVLTERLAGFMGMDVGGVWPYQALTHAEFADLLRDRWEGTASGLRTDLRVVGIVRTPTDASMSDFPFMFGTPALHAELDGGPGATHGIWVHFAAGADAADLLAEVPELAAAEAEGSAFLIDFRAERRPLDRGIAVLVAGLLALGGVTVVAGAVVVGQLVAREAQRAAPDRKVLRDLGLTGGAARWATLSAGVLAVAVAATATVIVAIVGSRWTPIGVARGVEPHPGVEVHLPIVAAGAVLSSALLLGLGVLAARGAAPATAGSRRRGVVPRVAALGAGPVPTVGAVLAFSGDGRRAGAGRTAFAGVVAAVCGIVAVLVFSSSLDRLVEDTERWGWTAHQDVELPAPVRDRTYDALDADPDVDAYGELVGSTAVVGGVVVDAYWFEPRKGRIGPAVLDGRLPTAPGEIALGPSLLDDLGLGIGDEVVVDGESRHIVGSTLPFARADRSSVTSGVLVPERLEGPLTFTTALVRFVDGADRQAAAERLYGDLEYDSPDPPVDVINLAELRPLPTVLGGVLAVVGLVALVQVALGIAGRSRGELAVLRSLGMARRAAARTVLAATALVGAVALVIGAVLGLVVVRLSWGAAAATTDLATDALVPTTVALVLVAVAVGAVAAGAAGGRIAVRRPAGQVLRSE